MKKYLSGFVVLLIAMSAAAFTSPKHGSKLDPTFDWQVYDASGNPTSTYILNETSAQMQSEHPLCNANKTICFREWNLGHTVPNNVYLKKAS